MAERDLIERLDAMIDAIVAGERAPALEPELAMLAVVASDLRNLPDPHFQARLRRELFKKEVQMIETVVPTTTSVRPYFIVKGADDLIAFLQQTFDAELLLRVPTPDDKVMHAEVRVGDSLIEVGDAGDQWTPIGAPVHAYVDDVDETYRRAIAAGATSLGEPVNQPYGDRESGVVASGIEWFIATHLEGGPRPPGFNTLTTSFRANGAKQLLDFLVNAFGAEHLSGGMEHAEIRLGSSLVELSEAHGRWGPTRGAFHLFVSDCDAVYAQALRAGATSMYEPSDKPYGERSAGVTDPWGNQWFIATPLAK